MTKKEITQMVESYVRKIQVDEKISEVRKDFHVAFGFQGEGNHRDN